MVGAIRSSRCQALRTGANGDLEYYYNGQWDSGDNLKSAWDYYGGQMPLSFINYDAAVAGSKDIVSGYNGNSMLTNTGGSAQQVGGMKDGLIGSAITPVSSSAPSGSDFIYGISDGSNMTGRGTNGSGNFQPVTAAPNVVPPTGSVQSATYNPLDPNSVQQVSAQTIGAPDKLTAEKAGYQGYDANTMTVDPATMTVQGQLNGLLDSANPLMQRAQQKGLDYAASRGLINSTMGAQAGQAALYDAAVPIATADANTYATAGKYNMDARNKASEFGAGAFNQAELANAGFANDTARFNVTAAVDVAKSNVANALQAGIVNAQQANDLARLNQQLATQVNLSNVENANQFQQFVMQQALQAGIINQQQANEISKFNAQQSLAAQLGVLGNDTSIATAKIAAQNKIDSINAEFNFDTLKTVSSSLSSANAQLMAAINNITQSDMSVDAKARAIDLAVNQYQAFGSTVSSIMGVDLSKILPIYDQVRL